MNTQIRQQHINDARRYMQAQNWAAATKEFIEAINLEPIQYNSDSTTYDPITFELAVCFYKQQDVVSAYRLLQKYMPGSFEQRTNRDKYLTACETAINSRITSHLKKARDYYTVGDEVKAKHSLSRIKDYCKEISQPIPREVSQLELKISWDEQKQHVNKFCDSIEKSFEEPGTDYNAVMELIKECQALYDKYDSCLSIDDKAYKLRLSGFLKVAKKQIEKQKDLAVQKAIYETLEKTKLLVEMRDLPNVWLSLCNAQALAQSIAGSQHVSSQKYNNPRFYDQSLQILKIQLEAYKDRFENRAGKMAQYILKKALSFKNAETGLRFEKQQSLKLIQEILWKYWYKFDKLEYPLATFDDLAKIIARQIYPTSTFTRFLLWTYDDLYLYDPETARTQAHNLLDNYYQGQNLEQMTLPVFAEILQAPTVIREEQANRQGGDVERLKITVDLRKLPRSKL
jgi:hypothetical protein